ncbi:MAG TPA: hypothetical protein VFH36_05870 [Acidimicrobiales bacterium]|nr:hypothetical protein [Acidimicrobiales bacterium]
MTVDTILAGISWTPEIRGILSVLVGVVVLMGSVYLLLATNLAQRLGFLVALAAVFGWLTIHGTMWLIYPPGTGPAGRGPAWEVDEIVYGDLSESLLDKAHKLDVSTLPTPEEVDDLEPEDVAALNEEHANELGGWELLSASDASRGEAQTAVDALLAEGIVPGLEEADSRVFTYAFETGGKPERESDAVVDRVTNRIGNTLRLTHPPHYAIVQLRPAVDPGEPVPGEAPPVPEADEDAQVVSAVLVRDIGQRRLPAALIVTASGLTFGLLCVMLHQRDRRVAEHRSAPLPATTGG